MTGKPLFVPLKTEYFRAFERGEKTIEYRIHGPRWSHDTCSPGRPVVLSHGYSGRRLRGRVRMARVIPASAAPRAVFDVWPHLGPRDEICAISIDLA